MIRVLTADELKNVVGDPSSAGFGAIETAQGCLPLTALDVDVQIEGLAAKTTVRQQFRNRFNEPLEATYVFPLPPRAAVTGFRMTVNDQVVEGRIDERGKAREDYDTAIAEGRTASIAEQERADIFTLRVGNIPPQSAARIELILVAPVAIDSLEATYRFPLVVARRYCPGVAIEAEQVGDGVVADTVLVPDASRISPPVLLPGFMSPVKLGIRVRIAAGALTAATGRASGSLGCTLPADEHRDGDGSLTITVVPEQRLDRDFILRWGIAADAVTTTTLLVEPDAARSAGLGTGKPADEAPGDGTFSLVIVPPAKPADGKQPPRDVVFMLDRSGSMGGWKIVAARRAVARMVDTLNADDRVAVMAFDSSVEHSGRSLRLAPATDGHRWRQLEWLGGLEARGGTELAAAFDAAFAVFQKPGAAPSAASAAATRNRVLVLVTDCQVGDEDRVIANLLKEIGGITLFVVGVDAAVNEGLLSRMADSTGGIAEMVESEERLDDVMERIQRRLAAPLVSDLGISAAGLEIIPESLVPAKLPNLVPGLPVVVRGRYRGRAAGGVCVEGRRSSGDIWKEAAEAQAVSTGCQSSLWARGHLRALEDRHSIGTGVDSESLEKRIVDLSTAFGVLCRFTAVVAIDPRQPDRKPSPDELRRIVQPVEMPWRMQPIPTTHMFDAGVHHFRAPSSRPLSASTFSFAHRGVPTDPQWSVRVQAASILSKARPRSGAIADVNARKVRALLKAVLALLKQMGTARMPRDRIETLATAYGRLYALPSDHAAIQAMLDVVADIAGALSVTDRWWQEAPVNSDVLPGS
jgi:Ca-activated chloride channel family protein